MSRRAREVCMRCQAHQENSSIVLRCERYKKRNISQEKLTENSSGKAHWCAKNKRTFRRTFDVGEREGQLLDLRGPWHGRQHLEGLLAVNLLAAADAEL